MPANIHYSLLCSSQFLKLYHQDIAELGNKAFIMHILFTKYPQPKASLTVNPRERVNGILRRQVIVQNYVPPIEELDRAYEPVVCIGPKWSSSYHDRKKNQKNFLFSCNKGTTSSSVYVTQG